MTDRRQPGRNIANISISVITCRSLSVGTSWWQSRPSRRIKLEVMSTTVIADWFDGLEAVLETESKLSGLLDHGPTIGQAREFLVARVLKTLLPASVHIGSGKVIDHQGHSSKQIDVVIYDPRFPMMNLEGGGLYFVEGVLATIEIKSTIDLSELRTSLDNCRSVLELWPHGEHPHEAEDRIRFYMEKGALTHAEAEQRFWYMFRPATYVFAFRSGLSLDTTCSCIVSWWKDIECRFSSQFPLLPRVITTGRIVGVVNDGRFNVHSAEGSSHVMAIFSTAQRFRWLALHLMDSVSQRLGLRNFREGFDYRLSNYYPLDSYVSALNGSDAKFITRQITIAP